MNTLTAVFGIALLAALLYTALKRSVPSYALFLSLAAALVILVRVGAAFRSVLLGVARLGNRREARPFPALSGARSFFCSRITPAPSARKRGRILWRGAWGLRGGVWCWRRHGLCWRKYYSGSGA